MKNKLHKKFKAKIKKVKESDCSNCNICNKCASAHLAWDDYRKQRNLTIYIYITLISPGQGHLPKRAEMKT